MVQDKDQFIIRQLAHPDTQRDAFCVIVRTYSECLYWKIRRIVLRHEDADDVLQNTFLKAWSNLDSFRNDSKLSTWLYRIAINESLDFVRKKKSHNILDSDTDCTEIAKQLIADTYFDGDETAAMLQEAIAKLPETQRTVFNLRYFDNMKYSEISRILGTSEGALKASYHIAVKKVTEYFCSHD